MPGKNFQSWFTLRTRSAFDVSRSALYAQMCMSCSSAGGVCIDGSGNGNGNGFMMDILESWLRAISRCSLHGLVCRFFLHGDG